jgi:hypothetical protein
MCGYTKIVFSSFTAHLNAFLGLAHLGYLTLSIAPSTVANRTKAIPATSTERPMVSQVSHENGLTMATVLGFIWGGGAAKETKSLK